VEAVVNFTFAGYRREFRRAVQVEDLGAEDRLQAAPCGIGEDLGGGDYCPGTDPGEAGMFDIRGEGEEVRDVSVDEAGPLGGDRSAVAPRPVEVDLVGD